MPANAFLESFRVKRCKIPACERRLVSKGMCSRHYQKTIRDSRGRCFTEGCKRKASGTGLKCRICASFFKAHVEVHAGPEPIVFRELEE